MVTHHPSVGEKKITTNQLSVPPLRPGRSCPEPEGGRRSAEQSAGPGVGGVDLFL